MKPLRNVPRQPPAYRFPFRVIVAAAALIMPVVTPSAQTATLHLNPAIEKLAKGQPIIGLQTSDLSLANARTMARVDFDYVYVDMEHTPLNLEGLAIFVAGMNDKATTLKKGNAQPKVALFARFPPPGREQAGWIAKQALDIGLMGVIFNTIENKEEALFAVRNMRYPPRKGAAHPEPIGLRGSSPGTAAWAWGVSPAEYVRRADVWPLNPEGDLLAIPMVETAEGVKNVDEIAAVPGVGAIFLGAGGDLSTSFGVPQDSLEVEAARQKILKACLAHKVACGITAIGKAEVDKRLKEGWRMIRTAAGGG